MKGTCVILLEPVRYRLFEHRGREGPKRFAPFDLGIENGLHVGAARIAHDRAVAERARPPFHAPLEPADDLAVGDCGGGAPAQLCLVRDFLDRAAGRLDLWFAVRQSAPGYRPGRIADPNRRDPSRTTARRPAGARAQMPRRSRRLHRQPPTAHRRDGTASPAALCRWRPSSWRSRPRAPDPSSP